MSGSISPNKSPFVDRTAAAAADEESCVMGFWLWDFWLAASEEAAAVPGDGRGLAMRLAKDWGLVGFGGCPAWSVCPVWPVWPVWP